MPFTSFRLRDVPVAVLGPVCTPRPRDLIALNQGNGEGTRAAWRAVNAISAGTIDTPFHEVFSTPEMMRGFAASTPLGRVGTAKECATVIAFLASEAASFIVEKRSK